MKMKFILLLILGIVFLNSCDNKGEIKEANKEETLRDAISGTWTLSSVIKKGKKVDHSGIPTAVSITFKDNGYYIFFDEITDEKISNAGVDKIQVRHKGQYEIKGETLITTHFVDDSLITKKYFIQNLTAAELSIQDVATKNIQNFKK